MRPPAPAAATLGTVPLPAAMVRAFARPDTVDATRDERVEP
jgi:hypothetical protein